MSFWNDAYTFEPRGERYVYRPTTFSRGFDVSKAEKDRLSRHLTRLQWRSLVEGSILLALIAGLFMTAVIETPRPILWFIYSSVAALAGLAVTVLIRRDRLVVRVLGHRPADVPRLPLGHALSRPRPLVTTRYAIPVLRSVVFLLGLTVAAADALVLYVIVIAFRFDPVAGDPEQAMAVEELFSVTVSNAGFWAIVVLFNAVLIAVAVLLLREVRRLRAAPDFE